MDIDSDGRSTSGSSSSSSSGGAGGTSDASSASASAAVIAAAESATEHRLRELRDRIARLEGDVKDVQRSTRITMATGQPVRSGSSSSSSGGAGAGGDDSMDVEPLSPATTQTDAALVRQYIVQMMAQLREGQAETPLKTKAMRELERLEKVKVYTHTVIKITLPDRTIIQANFHPKETVGHVKAVVKEMLHAGE